MLGLHVLYLFEMVFLLLKSDNDDGEIIQDKIILPCSKQLCRMCFWHIVKYRHEGDILGI
jgi:hypothetical protein